jgi:hypothetical protein
MQTVLTKCRCSKAKLMKSEVVTVANIHTVGFWVMPPYSLAGGYQSFEERNASNFG